MKAIVTIMLKDGVLDPQGKAVGDTLHQLGFTGVGDVRQGKHIELTLPATLSVTEAETHVRAMCERLLANTVMERYSIRIIDNAA